MEPKPPESGERKIQLRAPFLIVFLLWGLFLFPACRGGPFTTLDSIHRILGAKVKPENIFVAADFDQKRPLSVAILPLENRTQEKEASDLLRRLLYNNISSLAYQDVELSEIDRKLGDFDSHEIFKTIPPAKLGKTLGADALITGAVTDFESLYAGVFASVAVGAELKMLDAESGNILWSIKHKVTRRSGGVPTSPIGLILTSASTALNLSRYNFITTANQLCQRTIETIPPSLKLKGKSFPKISTLVHDGMNKILKKGDRLQVGIEGTPGLQAAFSIKPWETSFSMQEVRPGSYTGTYRIRQDDQVTDGVVTVHLSDGWGNLCKWEDTLGYVNVDGVPPDSPTGLRTVPGDRQVRLHWNPCNAPDVIRYLVWRSTTPLTGYREILPTEFTRIEDRNLANDRTYFYRVTAEDRAGNQSPLLAGVAATPVLPGPTEIPEILNHDPVWHSGANPYLLKGDVVIPAESTLTIHPGVVLKAAAGGRLIVQGGLVILGQKNAPVVMGPTENGVVWEGISFERCADSCRLSQFELQGARVGLNIMGCSPEIVNGAVNGCRTGIWVKGARAAPVLDNLTVYQNIITGISVMEMAAPRISRCRIAYNGEAGLNIAAASAKVLKNEISFNRHGIILDKAPVLVGANQIVHNRDSALWVKNFDRQALNVDLNYFGDPRHVRIFSSLEGSATGQIVVLETADYQGAHQPVPIQPYPPSIPHDQTSLMVATYPVGDSYLTTKAHAVDRSPLPKAGPDDSSAAPESGLDSFIQGVNAVRNKDYLQAITLFEKAKTEKPREAAARFWLGFCYLETGQLKKAMLNYHKASKLEPDNTDYLLHLGVALHIAGKRSHAQTVYLEVLRREPKNADAIQFLHSLREAGSIEPEGSSHD